VRHNYCIPFVTGPPNGPVLFCSLASVVCRHRLSTSVTLPAGGRVNRRARERSGGRHCTAGQYVTSREGDALFYCIVFERMSKTLIIFNRNVW